MADSVGGRLMTQSMPLVSVHETPIELGASHFIKSLHPLITATLNSLGINYTHTYAGGASCADAYFYMRDVRLSHCQLNQSAIPYNLDLAEQGQLPFTLYR